MRIKNIQKLEAFLNSFLYYYFYATIHISTLLLDVLQIQFNWQLFKRESWKRSKLMILMQKKERKERLKLKTVKILLISLGRT